ncbi:hypothetical protein SLEP1_g38954 [Rubroshorea leprosula]|uniref:Uncharacterized protein n=1 Tax=Rubroshorea leprosula TaxID=152421 RepID=A0AAV5KYY5_9ROSI|nr:hypothetical protein SLEP1_g38954 [Rubroshorea leprosula]
MSWLRSALDRAVEAGGKNNLTRTVRSYAESAVQQAGFAVAEGARLLQDRMGARNLQSIRQTVKRLEEVSVTCKGMERVQLLRRWLVALKEIERLSAVDSDNSTKKNNYIEDNNNSNANNNVHNNSNDKNADDQFSYEESKDSPKKPTVVYYVDPDFGGEPMNFREVFLHSQALEGITLSVILEAPNEEEVSLLLEIYRLCLAGGKEIYNSVMSSILSLAFAFSDYEDEVLVKREELLQYAQAAIAGLKINADLARIDAEVCKIKEKLEKSKKIQQISNENHEKSSEEPAAASTEAVNEALGQVELCFKLEQLLLKKKYLSNGDPPEHHAEKVHKLKVLSESLINSTSKAEKRILDHRYQKEEALNFRVAKANEVSQLEKELAAEIRELEHQRDDLEVQLKQVNSSLAAARARLHNAREERNHFDDASNQILVHLKAKEDELAKSVKSCRAEADVVTAWVNFLEDTWVFQASHTEQKDKHIKDELEKYGGYFVNLVTHLLSSYKEQLGPSISRIRELVIMLSSNEGSERKSKDEKLEDLNLRKNLEEEYKDLETKFVTTLSVVDTMKMQFYSTNVAIQRKNDEKARELFDVLEDIKMEFESIERPTLEIETPSHASQSPSITKSLKTSWSSKSLGKQSSKKGEKKSSGKEEAGKTKFDLGLDAGDHSDEETEEIGDWEFDAFDKDPQIAAS